MKNWNPFVTPQTAEGNKHTKDCLLIGQYTLLLISAYQLSGGNITTSALVLSMAFYLEKAAAKYYDLISLDKEKAKYISSNYSQLSQLSNLLGPSIKTVAQAIQEDVKSISQTFKKS